MCNSGVFKNKKGTASSCVYISKKGRRNKLLVIYYIECPILADLGKKPTLRNTEGNGITGRIDQTKLILEYIIDDVFLKMKPNKIL